LKNAQTGEEFDVVKYFCSLLDILPADYLMLGNGHPIACVGLFNAQKSAQKR
jgi:hypothetical protein